LNRLQNERANAMPNPGPGGVEIVEGDITKVVADAIVNAANTELRPGGGVCGAIFRAAGVEKLAQVCNELGQCRTGSAAITPAFDISTTKHIIHAAGPVYASHTPAEARRLLRSTYASALRLGAEHGCTSIALPAISTGIYGYPLQAACLEAVDVCVNEAEALRLQIKLVAFDTKTADCLRAALEAHRSANKNSAQDG
jgi:O-acetyl-ADP-ribose deacetylase (regulator of RNase III)